MTDVPKIAAPRSVADATALCERFARLDGKIAEIDAARNDAIAAANTTADKAGEPLIAERDAIAAKLERWWKRMAGKLTEGKRKSIELGGCMIGSRSGRDSLDIAGDEDAIVKALGKRPWAKASLLKVKTSLDKVAILKSVDGVYKKHLAALGLTRKPGEETFVLERVEQEGTRT